MLLKGNSRQKYMHPQIDSFCHSNLPGIHHFCQRCLYIHTGKTPWAAPPPAYNGSELSSRLVLWERTAQGIPVWIYRLLRGSSWYGYTDRFGKVCLPGKLLWQKACVFGFCWISLLMQSFYAEQAQTSPKMHCRDFFPSPIHNVQYFLKCSFYVCSPTSSLSMHGLSGGWWFMLIPLNWSHTHTFSWMIKEEELGEELVSMTSQNWCLLHWLVWLSRVQPPGKNAKYKEKTQFHIKPPPWGQM